MLTEKKRLLEVDAALDENHLALVPDGRTEPEYLLAVLEQFRLADLVQSGAVPSLNMTLIRNALVPQGAVEEQAVLAPILGELRRLARDMDAELKAVQRFRRNSVSQLLAGEVQLSASYDALMESA